MNPYGGHYTFARRHVVSKKVELGIHHLHMHHMMMMLNVFASTVEPQYNRTHLARRWLDWTSGQKYCIVSRKLTFNLYFSAIYSS